LVKGVIALTLKNKIQDLKGDSDIRNTYKVSASFLGIKVFFVYLDYGFTLV